MGMRGEPDRDDASRRRGPGAGDGAGGSRPGGDPRRGVRGEGLARDAGSDALDETKVDLEAEAEDRANERAEDVDLDEVYDKPERTDDASLRRFDPEAGKMGLAVRIRAVRERIDTPFGRMVVAMPILLASVSLGIFAWAFPTWPMIAAAGVMVPASGWLLWWRYQQWLGHKRYMYRLLESLGEDVSDWSMEQQYKKTKVRRAKR